MNRCRLVGDSQLIMTIDGYMPLFTLFKLYTERKEPLVASMSYIDRRVSWAPIKHMDRRQLETPRIRVMTDTFELVASPGHYAWVLSGETARWAVEPLKELFGHVCQFMGAFPMCNGVCAGYFVGPNCWYEEAVAAPDVDFEFTLDIGDGFVYTRTPAKEAGIWTGGKNNCIDTAERVVFT